jgi:hypothetical protein
MKEHVILADVYTDWTHYHTEAAPRYRIYVDDELMTERDFTLNGNEQYIRENISVRLPAGNHQIRLESVWGYAGISIRHVRIDGAFTNMDFVTE